MPGRAVRTTVLAAVAALATLAVPAAACTVAQWGLTAYPESVVHDATTRGHPDRAWFDGPVDRYRHGVFGREHEPSQLWVYEVGNHGLCGHVLTLDSDHVFEDLAPRLADLDGDGNNEIIVVRSHLRKGAQLAVYRWTGRELELAAATGYIGRTHRWLAPLAVGDLDGDGLPELAYVDRPHLARVLRVVRMQGDRLVPVARLDGVTNHKFGAARIEGGLRDCGAGPELIAASGDWTALLAIRLTAKGLTPRKIAAETGPAAFARALACE
ncbi:FG-GAP repeat domain-containing protein [Frigidibacter sp. ROC022]|uniref:FG-GAP repeat domain-containing protein n=1 Tax=Frigidibacter sp. ROC022 TaxID=2971796 RepID=UPI00215A42AE|nr:VCBS repeat-containing protein [Frigidibacter sp. ROC022]MCR8725320.1 VCBS repeat-containing protein [Frigidibacter sp. ROC022]